VQCKKRRHWEVPPATGWKGVKASAARKFTSAPARTKNESSALLLALTASESGATPWVASRLGLGVVALAELHEAESEGPGVPRLVCGRQAEVSWRHRLAQGRSGATQPAASAAARTAKVWRALRRGRA
jgi:hypothetical protein